MSFTNPQFLYGLFALIIPILVHLFNFRKAKKVYFSNTRFLKHIKETSSAKRKLKHYLVLLSRLLFLLFLVLAFAQPVINASKQGFDNKYVSIYLDNSKSMSNTVVNDKSGIDEGVAYVQEITSLYPKGTKFRLLTNSFQPFANTFKSAEKVNDHITELVLDGSKRTLIDVENRFQALNQGTLRVAQDVYYISDFQHSTLGDLHDWKPDSLNSYIILPLLFEQTANLSIDTLYFDNPFVMDRNHNKLIIELNNTGNEPTRGVSLKVFINSIQVSSATVSLDGNSTKKMEFDLTYELQDENKGKITFNDYPVTFDNEFFFTINMKNRIDILEIKQDKEPSVIGKVYGNDELFDFSSSHISNVNYGEIAASDLVVLNELELLPTALISVLQTFTMHGGRILIIPTDNSSAENHNVLLSGITTSEEIASDEFLDLSKPDFNNPFFENIFEETKATFNMPKAKVLYSWKNRGFTLLRYSLGNPYLSLFNKNKLIFLMGTPLRDEFTNFHKHAIFVPIMYKIATFNSENTSPPYYLLNQSTIGIRPDTVLSDRVYKIVQNEMEVIPEQRMVDGELLMQLPKQVLQVGYATITYQDIPKKSIAFNYNKNESDLKQSYSESFEELTRKYSFVQLFDHTDASAFSREIKEKYWGEPLWKYALLSALFFLLIEIIIIRYLK